MPRHLLFDADGTLYDFKASEEYALSRLFSSLSIPYIPDYIDIYHHENDICWHMFERGEMTIDELKSARFRMFFERMGLPYDAIRAGEEAKLIHRDPEWPEHDTVHRLLSLPSLRSGAFSQEFKRYVQVLPGNEGS